jgi:phospholipase/carboxylesterase
MALSVHGGSSERTACDTLSHAPHRTHHRAAHGLPDTERWAARAVAMSLLFSERPPAGDPAGLLILHHGRGADERDLLDLANRLDPDQRLHVAAPRAPLTLPGWPGYHWYQVPRVGFPDPATFGAAFSQLAAFHDELWRSTGLSPGQTVLGGFSMGAVMSYALGLDAGRPAPAGILAFSGFIPTVPGWSPSLEDRDQLRVFIAHGRLDPVMEIAFARSARDLLDAAGLSVSYYESDVAHTIDPDDLNPAAEWVDAVLGQGSTAGPPADR